MERATMVPDELQPEYLNTTMRKKLRWLALFLSCVFVMGNYFCYDYPACLKE